ncbi:unnamed protein product [Agarophyton chilense]
MCSPLEETDHDKTLVNEEVETAQGNKSSMSRNDAKEEGQKVSQQQPESKPKRDSTTKELEKEEMAAVFGDSDSDDEMELEQSKQARSTEDDQNDVEKGKRKMNGTKLETSRRKREMV